jgi:glycosyltransferase involved in cell wall biosynthesis
LIIGADDQLDSLKLRVRKDNLQKYVQFKGIVPYEKLVDYINCLDVGIALDTAVRVNSYGNSSQKIRQYLACGIPVICPHNTNHELVHQQLALSVPINDLDSLFNTIHYLFNLGPQAIRQYRQKARQYAIKKLSTDVAYEKRYRLWRKHLNG